MTVESLSYVIDTLYALFAMTLIILWFQVLQCLKQVLCEQKCYICINDKHAYLCDCIFIILLFGYSLAFGGFGSEKMSQYAAFLFQMAFVGKVINIMSGGVSERAKILPLAIFTVIMASVLYPIVVNVTWGTNFLEGTIFELSMHDLAGSTVIHSTGGWALLAAILIIGARKEIYKEGAIRVIPASNIPLVTLGAFYYGLDGLDLMVEVWEVSHQKSMLIALL